MPVLQIDIITDDLENLNWEEILQEVDEIEIHKFASRFDKVSNKFQKNGEEKNASIMALVSAMCKVALKKDPNDVPFKPFFSSSNGRTPIPDDLSENEKAVLANLEENIDDPELKARIADILWVTNKDYKAAARACDGYLESAKRLERNEEYSQVSIRLERAVALAALFGGQGSDKVQHVLNEASELLRNRSKEKITFATIAVIDLIIDRRHGDANEWAEIAKEFAEHLEEKEKYDQARMFWNRSAKAFQRANKLNVEYLRAVISGNAVPSFASGSPCHSPVPYLSVRIHELSPASTSNRKLPPPKVSSSTGSLRLLACTGYVNEVLERYPTSDEYGEGMVTFESGAVATIAGGWVDHANPNQIEISGTDGHLRVTNGELFLRIPERDIDASEPWTDLPEDHKHPLELFFDAVAGEENLPLITADEAAEVNHVITEIYNAHEQGGWVQL